MDRESLIQGVRRNIEYLNSSRSSNRKFHYGPHTFSCQSGYARARRLSWISFQEAGCRAIEQGDRKDFGFTGPPAGKGEESAFHRYYEPIYEGDWLGMNSQIPAVPFAQRSHQNRSVPLLREIQGRIPCRQNRRQKVQPYVSRSQIEDESA